MSKCITDSHIANFQLNPRPPKEKIFSFKTCLCHKEGVNEKEINVTAISWEKLKSAAEVRKDCEYENLKEVCEKGQLGVSHKSCYSDYTHKGHF